MNGLPHPRILKRLDALTRRARVLAESNYYANVLRGRSKRSPGRLLEKLARDQPHASALLFEERHYSYASLNAATNRVSSTLVSMGAQPRDCVCVLMDNRPELIFTLLGANKLGVVVQLPPPSLDDDELVRAVDASAPRWIMVSESELPRVARVLHKLPVEPHNVLVWSDAPVANLPSGVSEMNRLVSTAKDSDPRSTSRQTGSDTALHLPEKAPEGCCRTATMSNQRWLRTGAVLGRAVFRLSARDVAYVALPLQDVEGLTTFAAILSVGGTLALRRRFDATAFWRDCTRYGATLFPFQQTVVDGLFEAPSRPRERGHQVRVAFGSGLDRETWRPFRDRFGIPRIIQHYEGLAGNVFLFNVTNTPGMLGQLTPGLRVARTRDTTGEILVDHRERIIECRPGETGLLLARVDGLRSFDGFLDLDHTHAAMLVDAAGDGSTYFNTGRRVVVHEDGFVSLP